MNGLNLCTHSLKRGDFKHYSFTTYGEDTICENVTKGVLSASRYSVQGDNIHYPAVTVTPDIKNVICSSNSIVIEHTCSRVHFSEGAKCDPNLINLKSCTWVLRPASNT